MGTKGLNKNGHFAQIALHIASFFEMECFTELRQRRRHKSTVFVMEIRWIIVFKVHDQWQSIGRALYCG